MEQTLHALGELLQRAVPTFVLVLFLYFYLKAMLFKPLAKVLAERDAATKGARKQADLSFAKAEEKAASYEAALRDARAEVYKDQENVRRQWLSEQADHVAAARKEAEKLTADAKAQIAIETESARQSLHATAAELANQIAASILGGVQ